MPSVVCVRTPHWPCCSACRSWAVHGSTMCPHPFCWQRVPSGRIQVTSNCVGIVNNPAAARGVFESVEDFWSQ
jgi:hypothetical protein